MPSFTPDLAPSTTPPQAPLRQQVHAWLARGWDKAGFKGVLPGDAWDACPVEDFDMTHKGALLSAKGMKMPPRAVAELWVEALDAHPFVEAVEVAGPGHLNIRFTQAALDFLLTEAGPFFPTPEQPPTLVEFVSANPTGPLHLGHARQAVLGSTLVNLLRKHGWTVGTEFYSNDAGNQIDMLVQSVQLRMRQAQGATLLFERNRLIEEGRVAMYAWDPESGSPPGAEQYCKTYWEPEELAQAFPEALWFPQDAYHGKDIVALASAAVAAGVQVDDVSAIKAFAIAQISAGQQATLSKLRVSFDHFTSERGFHESGAVSRVVEHLKPHCYRALQSEQEAANPKLGQHGAQGTIEKKPAWYLRTSAFGDDNDRVMIKPDGSVPYFVPDVAYHLDKYARGWERAVNIQGSDHHGTLSRVRAGVQFLHGPADYPQAIFHTMVSVLKDGKPLVASKRAGTALSADEIMDMIGVDAFRMSLLSCGPGSELTVDINAWQTQGLSNPVYALQYAAARLNSMVEKSRAAPEGSISAPTYTPAERELAKHILALPDRLQRAALALDPVRPAQFVKELAQKVHAAYEHSPKLVELDAPSRLRHQGLFSCAHQVLVAGHELLGLQAPERMVSLTLRPASP